MESISGLVDSSSPANSFDFSLDVSHKQNQEKQQRSQDTAQSTGFNAVLADTLAISPEALQKAKVLNQSDAVIASDTAQTQQQGDPSQDYKGAQSPWNAWSYGDNLAGTYTKDAIAPQQEAAAVKAPDSEELRRFPTASTLDISSVAALYAGNVTPVDTLQTRTFTPTNSASSYEGMRLRHMDSSRPVSIHINAAQSTSLAYASSVSPEKATAAYKTQASAGVPTTSLMPMSRWSVGVDIRV